MNNFLLSLHSIFRWLVLFSLIYAIYVAFKGKIKKLPFTKKTDHIRHWTATLLHIQLMVGILLYTQSPTVNYFFEKGIEGWNEFTFFGAVHLFLMLTAIAIITIGSAKAKRKLTDSEKFKTMFRFFSIGLLIILIAIPWPFSPLAVRPYVRPF